MPGGALTIDMHSHAGRFVRDNTVFEPVAEPMRAGGLAVACLAIVSDSPTHRIFADGRIHPTRLGRGQTPPLRRPAELDAA